MLALEIIAGIILIILAIRFGFFGLLLDIALSVLTGSSSGSGSSGFGGGDSGGSGSSDDF